MGVHLKDREKGLKAEAEQVTESPGYGVIVIEGTIVALRTEGRKEGTRKFRALWE